MVTRKIFGHLAHFKLNDTFVIVVFLVFTVYGINSILYQRGIYPPETFTRVQKYGLTILVTADGELKKYLTNILADVKGEQLLTYCSTVKTSSNALLNSCSASFY